MSKRYSSSSLLLLSQAARAAHTSRGNFFRLFQKQLVPPPVLDLPQRRWSEDQIERWRLGQVKSNSNEIWYEWIPDTGEWRKLPNQYLDLMPVDAA